MNSNRKIMLGLAVVAILTLTVGVAYSIAAQPQVQQGSSFPGMTGKGGYGGGMMGGWTPNPGSMMRGPGGMMGGFGDMMGGYARMMGSMESAMGQFGGMMSRMIQQMGGLWG